MGLAAAFLVVLAARAPPPVGFALVVAPLVATPVRLAEALLLPAADLGPVAAAVAFAAFVLVLAVCEAALPLLVAIAKPISWAYSVAGPFFLSAGFLPFLTACLAFSRSDEGR